MDQDQDLYLYLGRGSPKCTRVSSEDLVWIAFISIHIYILSMRLVLSRVSCLLLSLLIYCRYQFIHHHI